VPICRQGACKPGQPACLSGFAIQGNFEAARRNYTRLWRQVQQAVAAGAIPTAPPARPFHLHLVGRGDATKLGMPREVAAVTSVHFSLRFPQYYKQVGVAG
jgi:hypothetical protein